MAAAGTLLTKEQLLCPICLDLFNQPVSTPCGHNFCRDCIQRYWQSANLSQCPMCKQKFYRRPELKVNTFICTFKKHHLINPTMNMQDRVCKKHAKLLDLFCNTDQTCVCQVCIKRDHSAHRTVSVVDESRDRRAQIQRINAEVEEMIKCRLEKISEINQTVELSRGNTDREIEESMQVFNNLLHFVQRGQAEVVEAIGAKQRKIQGEARGLIVELEQEINELRRRNAELEELSRAEDDLFLIRSFPGSSTPPATRDWSTTCVESAVYVGTVRRARAKQCAVDVTLDPDTAHPKLVLSENRKQVFHCDVAQSFPDNPMRFYPGVSVLGKEGFSSGRLYCEVQVKGKTEWDIGVGLQSISRKGGTIVNPETGYWALGMRKDSSYWALSSTPIRVPLVGKPQRVGVYVDLDWGQVSFYDTDSASHIYSFTGYSFNDRLFLYLNPRRNHGGVNSAPLIIVPVGV
uniref:Bloodthirsty-related gene family, member 7 n=1 Tax=Gasterosteus aculeatus TaxID=69293 RepID=G3NHG0_GASAC